MLLAFDPSKVRFQNVKIKRVSAALGGSINILDEAHFDKTGKEKFNKIDIPLSLARMFKVKYKITQFMVPHEGVIMWYDDKVVTIEKAIENARIQKSFDGVDRKWVSNTEHHYGQMFDKHFKNPLTDWFFDGLYIYNFHNQDLKGLVKRSAHLDEHGAFRSVEVQAIHLTYLNFKPAAEETRSCVAAVISDDVFSISAPIWKQFNKKSRAVKTTDDDDVDGKTSLISAFKGIDSQVAVNLNFALNAAKLLAEQFGYESIQPLQLPTMMVQLKTVNLPRLPKEVKSTTDIGLKFTHGLSWLLGLQYNAKTPEQYHTVRQMIKYLMTKGYFWKEKTKANRILINKQISDVPVIALADLNKFVEQRKNQLTFMSA